MTLTEAVECLVVIIAAITGCVQETFLRTVIIKVIGEDALNNVLKTSGVDFIAKTLSKVPGSKQMSKIIAPINVDPLVKFLKNTFRTKPINTKYFTSFISKINKF